jgi:signal transduction histidine kinase
VVFLLLALAAILNGLQAHRTESDLRRRLESGAAEAFSHSAAEPSGDNWIRLVGSMDRLGFDDEWCVRRVDDGAFICDSHNVMPYGSHELHCGEGLVRFVARSGYELLLPPRATGISVLGGLSGIFWAVAAGTVLLMLVVYGLLLRLVLRPVENLVAASRVLSSGRRPEKVPGEWRTDEMGELAGAFNLMAGEVSAGREELERRVEEATREYERAQRRLVLEQRLAATGKLAAGLAHEINNPLGGMINAARTLEKEEGLSERAREYVALVREGLARIAALVERMRTFSRPRPKVGPVDLGEAARAALSFARHRAGEEGVEVEEDFARDLPPVTGDAGELQQVLLNLVLNALDAMRSSAEKRLRVKVAREGAGVVCEVSDTGSGMGPEELAGAFDLFHSTKDEAGSGLGLAMAHKIVTDHGGEIELESVPGRGTTARVRLPA